MSIVELTQDTFQAAVEKTGGVKQVDMAQVHQDIAQARAKTGEPTQ